MQIVKIEISSYRSCRHTSISPHKELSALIGVNGSGKTNILNGILLLRKMCKARHFYAANERHPASLNTCQLLVSLSNGSELVRIKTKLAYDTNDRNIDDVYYSKVQWSFPTSNKEKGWIEVPIELIEADQRIHVVYQREGRLTYRDLSRGRLYTSRRLAEVMPKGIAEQLGTAVRFFSNISYYSATQFSDPSRCPPSVELEEQEPTRRYREHGEHFQFIYDLYKAYKKKDPFYRQFLDTIGSTSIGLIDDLSFKEVDIPSDIFEVRSGGRIIKRKRARHLVVPSVKIGTDRLSLNQLSEGTFKTVALLFYLLSDNSDLILLEEPEVCVHHGLLSSVLELIRQQSKKKQIIISTHSDYVLDHIAPENVHVVRIDKEKGTSCKPISKQLSQKDYSALKSYLASSGNLGEYWREGGFDNEN